MGVIRLARAALAMAVATWSPVAIAETYAAPAHGLVVRAAPGGAVIATLAPGTGPIEATGADSTGTWLRIGLPEGDGWVARDALVGLDVPRLRDSAVPDGLICFGVEPNWSVRLAADGAAVSFDGATSTGWSVAGLATAAGRLDMPARLDLADGDAVATLVVRRSACSDGMSDRTHAWQADLLGPAGGPALRTGCCRLPAAP